MLYYKRDIIKISDIPTKTVLYYSFVLLVADFGSLFFRLRSKIKRQKVHPSDYFLKIQ